VVSYLENLAAFSDLIKSFVDGFQQYENIRWLPDAAP
jgi:hypothetical protein